jgi:hypothetical protein
MERGRAIGRRRAVGGCVLAAALLALTLATGAGATVSGRSTVVPPGGSVAGQPYAYWLQQVWANWFAAPSPGPPACETATVGGTTVVLVEDIKGGKSSCSAKTGQPIFVNELGKECAAIPGQHNGYGTSDSALQQCARAKVEAALISVYIDGHRLSDFGKYYWKQATAFTTAVGSGRFKGYHQTSTRASAWGWSLLFKSLPKGTHTIQCNARYRTSKKTEFTSTVKLHVR